MKFKEGYTDKYCSFHFKINFRCAIAIKSVACIMEIVRVFGFGGKERGDIPLSIKNL